MEFKAADGVTLAHIGREGDTQADFYPLARALAKRGYLALTYNGRGVCGPRRGQCSEGLDAAREWYGWASEPKQLEILPGAEHGTDMLRKGQPTARPLV